MRPTLHKALLASLLSLSLGSAVLAGEIVVGGDTDALSHPRDSGPGVIIISPDPLAPAAPGLRDNERAVRRNTNRARDYAVPGAAGTGGDTVVIVPDAGGGEAASSDTQRKNAASLRHSRNRAKSLSTGTRTGQTILVTPGSEHGTVDNATRVQMNTDKARGYVGEGSRPNCSNAQVIVGRIEGSANNGRVSSVVTGSDAVVSGVECR
jgi:hypothetical protein